MRTISVLEVAKRVGIAWRTALARLTDGRIPGRTPSKAANRGWEVNRQVFEKWLDS